MNEITCTAVAISMVASSPAWSIQRLAWAVIAFGLATTAAWICLSGYGALRLIEFDLRFRELFFNARNP